MTFNPAYITGSLSATGSVTLGIGGEAVAIVAVSGTYTGVSGVIEGSVDGSKYYTIQAYALDTGLQTNDTIVLSATNKAWFVICSGLTHLRFRVTAISTGGVRVAISEFGSKLPVHPKSLPQHKVNTGKNTYLLAEGTGSATEVVYAGGKGILHNISSLSDPTIPASLVLYDNASATSGTKLYATDDASLLAGDHLNINVPFSNGITAAVVDGSPSVVITYSTLT